MDSVGFFRNLEVTGEFDVIVAGSGPAGLTAAVSAARKGAKTALVESLGIIGGNLTSGHVGPIMGDTGKGTIGWEIISKLGVELYNSFQDVEMCKIILTDFVYSEGVQIYLQTPAVDAVVDEGKITGIVISTKSGMKILKGKIIVDATGDGTISYLAGAEVMMGRDGDGLLQPASLMYTIAGVDKNTGFTIQHENYEEGTKERDYLNLCEQKAKEGELPANVTIVRLYKTVRDDERVVNATQRNYINGLDTFDVTRAEHELRNQILQTYKFIKKYTPGFENCYIKSSASTLGVRETRRIKGEYLLKDSDIIQGLRFEDVMVHNAGFVIDIHNPDGGGQAEVRAQKVKPYDIPYRCFVPLKVDNLYTAGRCISGTHRAHASYRVMNICMAMGQAVGIAAAIAAESGVVPRKLDYKKVQRELLSLGVELFD